MRVSVTGMTKISKHEVDK